MTKQEGEVHSSGVADVGIREGFTGEVALSRDLKDYEFNRKFMGQKMSD